MNLLLTAWDPCGIMMVSIGDRPPITSDRRTMAIADQLEGRMERLGDVMQVTVLVEDQDGEPLGEWRSSSIVAPTDHEFDAAWRAYERMLNLARTCEYRGDIRVRDDHEGEYFDRGALTR